MNTRQRKAAAHIGAEGPLPRSSDTNAQGGEARATEPGDAAMGDAAMGDAVAVANRLRPVLLRLHRYLRGEAHELDVTSTQATLLGAINRAPGIGVGELAAQEHITAPTLVAHIDKLAAAGLVARTRDNPSDRRRVGLSLTAEGTRVLLTLRERRTAWLAARLGTLSPAELAAIEAAIEPLRQLTAIRADAGARTSDVTARDERVADETARADETRGRA